MPDLSPFTDVDVAALRWIRTSVEPPAYSLLSGDRPLVDLRWERPTGSLATARSSGGTWSLKRGGFLGPHVTIRTSPDGTDLARLEVHLRQGVLDVLGGRSYRLRRAGLLVPAWQVTDATGRRLAHIEPVRVDSRLEGGSVEVAPEARGLADLPLLLVVGWYFIVLAWFEDEALAASSRFLDVVSGP